MFAAILTKATSATVKSGVEILSASQNLSIYLDVYTTMGLLTVGIGLFLVLISKPLNKLMHGVE